MDGEDFEDVMAKFGAKRASVASVMGRRARETRPLARADRKHVSTRETKSRQLNVKITESLFETVQALARNLSVPIVAVIERAIEDLARAERGDHA